MNNLQLQAKVLQTSLGLDDEGAKQVEETMRRHTVSTINMLIHLRDKNVDIEAARGIMEEYGVIYDGKTKRFK